MTERLKELDYVKCLCIILMVIFHLAYFGDKYPYAKDIVYTFHMPAFLIISGYLLNVSKPAREFEHRMIWIFIPYAIMEAAYIIASAFMPVRGGTGGTDNLSVWSSIQTILFAPIGPYWYLHTLVICSTVHYLVFKMARRLSVTSRLILSGIALYVVSLAVKGINIDNALYILAGAALRQTEIPFTKAFMPSRWSILAITVMCFDHTHLSKSTVAGVIITWLAISFMLWTWGKTGPAIRKICCAIGRNTLIILVFSPAFTMLAKVYQKYFDFDPSGMLFMISSTALCIAGCFAIAFAMDKLHMTRYMFGQSTILLAKKKTEQEAVQ